MIVTAALAEVRDRFPVWFGVWLSIGHALTALFIVQPPQGIALATVLLPLSWVVAFYAALPAARRPSRAVLTLLIATAPMCAVIWWLPSRLMFDDGGHVAVRFSFELLAPVWALALLVHCARERGWAGVLVFFGLGAIYGLILESSGIDLGYFSEAGYRMHVPFTQTPLASVAGWCTIFYPCVYSCDVIAQRLKLSGRVVLPAALVTANALSADLHFDPIATALEMWVWSPRLEPVWLGVPLVNFTSWFAAVFAIAVVYYWTIRRSWTPRTRPVVIVLCIPAALMLSAALNLLAIGLLEGFNGPSWSIFLEAVHARLAS